MKLKNYVCSNQAGKSVVLTCAALVLLFHAHVASAQVVVLTDNNSIARIDTSGGAGMFDWAVDGQDQLAQQWFWFRVGATPEAGINTISAPSISTPTPRHLTTLYANLTYSVQIDYVLTGGAIGSGQSDIGESILIRNLSGASLDFHFFQYSDFDLGGTPLNDTVQLGMNLSGTRYNEAVQSEPGVSFTETVTVPGAHRGEAAFFNATLVKLNDALPSVLNNVTGPVGPGDATWAFQWDFTILPGGSALISKDKYLEITVVPEPSSATVSLLGLSLLLTTQWCRRRMSA